MIQWLNEEQGGVALDLRHDPALISTWYGQPSCALIDRYFAWSDATAAAALAAEQQFVHIVDLRQVEPPSANVRRRALEHMRTNLAAEIQLASIVVLDSPLLASLIRVAHRAPLGRESKLMLVDTLDEAIERGLAELRDARIPPPMGLAPGRYRTPMLELGS